MKVTRNFTLTLEDAKKIEEAIEILEDIQNLAGESQKGIIELDEEKITTYTDIRCIIETLEKFAENEEYTII